MKEESVLNVLMYLFKNHLHENLMLDNTQNQLVTQLEKVGFDRQTIYSAFDWLDRLGEQALTPVKSPNANAIRVYTPEECEKMSRECRGFLTFLEEYGILKPYTREMVITQALALQEEGIDIHLIKWVTLLVLFTQPGEKNALARMEFLVLDDPIGSIH